MLQIRPQLSSDKSVGSYRGTDRVAPSVPVTARKGKPSSRRIPITRLHTPRHKSQRGTDLL